MKKILLVEDEKHIVQIVRDALEDNNFHVIVARDGIKGSQLAMDEEVDLVILDIMLPGMNGYELCQKIKKRKIILPVIMLTAKEEEADKIMAFDLGADDYMTKPFSVKELIARINVCLRHSEIHKKAKGKKTDVYTFGDVKIDFLKMEAFKKGKKLVMTKKEFDILKYMINRRGEVITRTDLLDVIWGYETSPATRTVDAFISRIRKKIEDKPSRPKYIKSIRNAGYKLDI